MLWWEWSSSRFCSFITPVFFSNPHGIVSKVPRISHFYIPHYFSSLISPPPSPRNFPSFHSLLFTLSLPLQPQKRFLCVSFSKDGFWLVHMQFASRVNSDNLHNSKWITFPTDSCLVLYSFCTSLLYSLIM